MCAIFGSFDRSMYDILFEANKKRGLYAYSHLIYGKKNKTQYHISKKPEIPTIDKIKHLNTNQLYLGHFQAPTSDQRKWTADTSHPFEIGQWVVAHNGVVSNQDSLETNLEVKFKVDTNYIPWMLSQARDELTDAEKIAEVLDLIQGTAACWIVNTEDHKFYLIRRGSTLFANKKTGSFSSVECKSDGWEELQEGIIYEMQPKTKTIVEVGTFNTKSPFLFV